MKLRLLGLDGMDKLKLRIDWLDSRKDKSEDNRNVETRIKLTSYLKTTKQ